MRVNFDVDWTKNNEYLAEGTSNRRTGTLEFSIAHERTTFIDYFSKYQDLTHVRTYREPNLSVATGFKAKQSKIMIITANCRETYVQKGV